MASVNVLFLLISLLSRTQGQSCDYKGTLTGHTTLTKTLLTSCPRDTTYIDISYNEFTTVAVDAFDGFYALAKINITNNKITELPVGLFDQSFKAYLTELYGSDNMLESLHNDVFENNFNLRILDLSNNRLNFIDTNVFHKDLKKLELVNVSYNQMTYFEPWPYIPETPQTDDIDLVFDIQHNLIEKFTNTMNWTYNLVEPYEYLVNLQFNKISEMSDDVIFMYRDKVEDQSVLTELLTYNVNVTNNPYFCNCKLYELVRDLHASFFLYYRVEEYRYRCASPPHLANVDLLHDLDLDQFVCNITDNCPLNCTCQEKPYISTLEMNCTNANLRELPQTLPPMSDNIQYVSLYLSGNRITEITKRNYSNIIYNLTVSNNNINYIDGEALKEMVNLNNLDISGNALKYVPKEIQKLSFHKVKVRGNPFQCECNMTWMADWIALSNGADESSITCSSDDKTHVIKDVTEKGLDCNISDFVIIFSVIMTVVVGVIIGGIITARRCPYETKVLIYRFLRIHPRDLYKVDQDETMHYDAYLSFDGEDIQVRQWIKTIFMKKLEENGKKKYKFFCPLRDALVGEDYGQDLVQKMTQSRRIFVLLSPGYFTDTWRIYESDQAEMEHNANSENHPRVVYIIWHDENEVIKQNLQKEPWKSRLIGKRVLSPDKRFFWSKIRYELPIKPRSKINRVNNSYTDIQEAERDERQQNNDIKVICKKDLTPLPNRPQSAAIGGVSHDNLYLEAIEL
ncbi:protein toll-like [Mytilus edulis]|uniref:protein toll-like n=1 Tax=Mytilus edulis TaxID=6550 RepID=UPI0039EF68EC